MIAGGRVTLTVKDVGRAVRFYVETLGMKLVDERVDESIIDAGGLLIGLRRGSGEPARASATTITLYTKAPLEQTIAIYENRGVVFDGPSFRDPDENVLTLGAVTSPAGA
jgi:catechol 2,3-dioxygenase-like lactoylglutathione lyase family enzyme